MTGPQAAPVVLERMLRRRNGPLLPHGRKLHVAEVGVRVPLDCPCEDAGLPVPGRTLNG